MSNRRGPFVIKWIFTGGATVLEDMDQVELLELVNSCYLKKYYQ